MQSLLPARTLGPRQVAFDIEGVGTSGGGWAPQEQCLQPLPWVWALAPPAQVAATGGYASGLLPSPLHNPSFCAVSQPLLPRTP